MYLNYGAEHLVIAVANPGVRVEEDANFEFDLHGGRLYLFDVNGRRVA